MGVDNHAFCLALHNPSLQGVDPFSEDLTNEQKIAIALECQENPWYFFREVACAPAASGTENIRFKANRGNISLFWLFFVHITTFLIQPRQTGKSFSTDILMTWLLRLGTKNTKMNLLTKDDQLRVSNIKRIKDIADTLPDYLYLKRKDDSNNTEKITVNALGNIYTSSVSQASAKAALNLGRGLTLAINHIDELAFIKNLQITLESLLASGGKYCTSLLVSNNEEYMPVMLVTA
jgi:hypothetical protein